MLASQIESARLPRALRRNSFSCLCSAALVFATSLAHAMMITRRSQYHVARVATTTFTIGSHLRRTGMRKPRSL